jgi:hypothetical protein
MKVLGIRFALCGGVFVLTVLQTVGMTALQEHLAASGKPFPVLNPAPNLAGHFDTDRFRQTFAHFAPPDARDAPSLAAVGLPADDAARSDPEFLALQSAFPRP